MATHRASQDRRTATRTTASRRAAHRTAPARATVRAILVAGLRGTELRALERAFAGRGLRISVAATKEEARALIRAQRWFCVLLDARWEAELAVDAALQAERVRCFVAKTAHASRTYQPIPLGQSDVDEILGG